jgi:hypothetical protein
MRRYALRDDQWDRIKDLLPGREASVGVTAADNPLFVEAVLYAIGLALPGATCRNASRVEERPSSLQPLRKIRSLAAAVSTSRRRCRQRIRDD